MKRNKIILGMTALLVFTSLVGCKSNNEGGNKSSSEVEVIHVSSVAVSPARASIYLNDEHPSIQLEAVVLPENAYAKQTRFCHICFSLHMKVVFSAGFALNKQYRHFIPNACP